MTFLLVGSLGLVAVFLGVFVFASAARRYVSGEHGGMTPSAGQVDSRADDQAVHTLEIGDRRRRG